jgi:diguanylate cyclase (GGDEF)-like protein
VYELAARPEVGGWRVLDTAYRVVDDETGEVLYHGILVDVTGRKILEEQLREMAIRDSLTGCHNRRFLQETAATLEGDAATWGVIAVDIDNFKAYNDQFGHDRGDELLVRVARFLCSEVRVPDLVIRTGGDEFAILLPMLDSEDTKRIAERLEAAGRNSAPASFALGWAARQDQERVEETLSRADHHLIRVKVGERHLRARRMPDSGSNLAQG